MVNEQFPSILIFTSSDTLQRMSRTFDDTLLPLHHDMENSGPHYKLIIHLRKRARRRVNESIFLFMWDPSRKQTHPGLSHSLPVFFSQRAECDLKQDSTVHFLHVWGSPAAQRKPLGKMLKVIGSERVTSLGHITCAKWRAFLSVWNK